MATSPQPLTGPGGEQAAQDPGAGPGGTPIAPQPAQPDPNLKALMLMRQLIEANRQLAVMYPAAQDEVRMIGNAVQRMQQKIVQSRPAPEPLTPPV